MINPEALSFPGLVCVIVWINVSVLVTRMETLACSIFSALFTCNLLLYGHHDNAPSNISFFNQQLNLYLFSAYLV